MDCPNCGTWNPTDKAVCWRCQTALPRPEAETEPVKKSSANFYGIPVWVFVVIVLVIFAPLLWQCSTSVLGR